MKKFILIFSILLLVAMQANSQSFIFKREGPLTVVGDTINPVVTHFTLKNTSATTQNFRLVRANYIPSTWLTQVCCLLGCMSYELDTIPPIGYPGHYTLSPGAVDSITVDFTGHTLGTGKVIMKAFIESNPSNFQVDSVFVQMNAPGGINQISSVVKDYELKQNYPNPFNPSTSINFSIPKSTEVSLVVYDLAGKEVARLLNNTKLSQGVYKYDFNSGNFNLSSGVYFYKLETSDFSLTKKMILIK